MLEVDVEPTMPAINGTDNDTTMAVQFHANMTTTFDDWQELIQLYNIRPLSNVGYLGCATYLVIIGITATVGNMTTLIMFMKNKKLRQKPHNMLIINLAASDLGISVFGYPLTTSSCFAQRYLWGMAGCKIQGFTTFFFAMADMYTLTALSVYRWVAICHPHDLHKYNFTYTLKVIVWLWLAAFVTTAPPLMGLSRYIFEPFGTSCTIEWSGTSPANVFYVYMLILFCYVVPVAIMVYCYHKVVARSNELMRSLKLKAKASLTLGEAEEANLTLAESKVTWISLLMVTVFVIIWSPYTFVCIWAIYDVNIPVWLNTLPTMCAKSSCMLNPVIFFLSNPLFRETFKTTFFRSKKIRPEQFNKGPPTFKVNKTKDGVFIGENNVTFRKADTTLF